MARRAINSICESLGFALCELAFEADCRGVFAFAYSAGCRCYLKADETTPT
jgi:hypothetical protein